MGWKTLSYRRSSRDYEAEKGKRLYFGFFPFAKRGGEQNSDRKYREGDEEGAGQSPSRGDCGGQEDRNKQNRNKPAQVKRRKHLA